MEAENHDRSPQDLNLTAHRAPGASVWDRRGWTGTNELATTRWLVSIGSGALAAEGLRRRGFGGAFLVGLGGTLVWWTLMPHGQRAKARRWFAEILEHTPWGQGDLVTEASADSFPASDAPSFTPAVGTGLKPKARSRKRSR